MAEQSASRMLDQFVVRLPEGMRNRLKKIAAENRRSMNSEIVVMLENACDKSSGKNEKGGEAVA